MLRKSCFYLLLFLFFLSEGHSQDRARVDSLKAELQICNSQPETCHDTTRIKLLNDLGWEIKYQTPDTAILLGKQALKLSESVMLSGVKGWQKGIANSYSNLGVHYKNKGDYTLSLSCHLKALEIRETQKDQKGIATTLSNIGIIYFNQGDYPKALENYFKVLKMDEEMRDKAGIAIDFGNIGLVYYSQGDYPKALEYYFKALKLGEELGDKTRIVIQLGNIGSVYKDQKDYPKALEYYFKALKANEEIGRKTGIAINFNNIGLVYRNQGDYPKALEYYFKTLKIKKELGAKNLIAITFGNIGLLYIQTGRFAEAEVYLDSALAISESIGALSYMKDHYLFFSDLYDSTAHYKQALTHYKKYITAKDSLFNEKKAKDIGRLEQKHEFEMAMLQEEQIKNEELRIKNEQISRRNNLQYSLIIIGLLIITILIPLLGSLSRFFGKVRGVSVRVLEAIIFIAFMIFFEFLLVLLDPTIESWSGGEPLLKLIANVLLAATIFPLHSFFEGKVMKRALLTKRTQQSNPAKGSYRSGNGKTLLLFLGLVVMLGLNSGFDASTPLSTKIDSLNSELQTPNLPDTTRINLLLSIADKYSYQTPDSAIYYATQAKEISERINDPKYLARAYRELGWDYYVKGDYPLALELYFHALEINERNNDQKGIASTLGNIGIVFFSQGDYPKALEYYFKVLKAFQKLGNKSGVAINLGNIGLVYRNQGDYPKALEYYFKALKMDEELGRKSGMAVDIGNIGLVYSNQGDYPKALVYYFKALKMDEELGNKNGIARHLGNIGVVYSDQGDYPKALEYYFKALAIDEELGKKKGIAVKLGNIGSLYTETGRFTEAEVYLDSALVFCESIGVLNYTMNFEKSMSHLYDTTASIAYATGNHAASAIRYKQALIHYKKYSIAKDSLFNEEKAKNIGRLEQKHEFEMAMLREEQIKNEELRIQNEKIVRRNKLQYSGIVLGLVFLFMGIFIGARRFRKIKAHKTYRQYTRIMEGALFISFLIFFEFMLVLLDNLIEQLTGGEPLYKLLINALLAGAIFPLHSFLETKLKGRVIKTEREKWSKSLDSDLPDLT